MTTDASPSTPAGRPLRRKGQLILQAARTVFLDGGYDASTMDAIAREAGVSKATLYAHFANKEDLFEALIRFECRSIGARIYHPDAQAASIEQELGKLARNMRMIFTEKDGLDIYRIVVPLASRFPRLAQIFFDEGPGGAIRDISAYLQTLCEAGRLRIPDIETAAEQFISLVSGDMELSGALSLPPRSPERSEALVQSSIEMFLKYYSAQSH